MRYFIHLESHPGWRCVILEKSLRISYAILLVTL
ncbi:hypothetical protein SAMN00808754_1206 [Thermanaeromonas toyohensis ToBE]|uniref:Uncharacterized protein n=1 Tax=Thermanaeromonas toyohensis ToBE TaxID=698762 RepID=A0A1W1VPJ1_9FIRM|nr:hypothetical protein SAMN00808754_1206 [Thermanaeromonas toyohensis ToBE]